MQTLRNRKKGTLMTYVSGAAGQSIPERPALPLIGHALDLSSGGDGLAYLMKEAKELGPLFRVRVFGRETLVVSGLDLAGELTDTSRFRRIGNGAASEGGRRPALGDAPDQRPEHDILTPALSRGAIRDQHAATLQVVRSLMGEWDQADGGLVDVSGGLMRLTVDAVGLCGFGVDFASFRWEEPHPFVAAMNRVQEYRHREACPISGPRLFRRKWEEQFRRDQRLMTGLIDQVLSRRRASGEESPGDLLGRLLHTIDPQTGEPPTDAVIRNQVMTFLLAGQAAGGALAFALYHLTKHPEVLARAHAEVDALWGDVDSPSPDVADLDRLPYLGQIVNESVRLWPTTLAYAVEPLANTVIGGTYRVRRGEVLCVLVPALHRDPAWGENVELFDPGRFSPEREAERPTRLFKPFGNDQPARTVRQFVLHKVTLLLGLLLHRYRLIDHADYTLRIEPGPTVLPDGFTLRLARRTGEGRSPDAACDDSAAGGLALRHGMQPMEVVDTYELSDPDHDLGRPTRFVKLRLPEGVGYRTGDQLSVLPRNPQALAARVATRFDVDLDHTVRHRDRRPGGPTVNRPLTLRRLLTEFVELQDTATQDQVGLLAEHTVTPHERRALAELSVLDPDAFQQQVTHAGLSLLDLLERYRACRLPVEEFLELLPPRRPRTYAISSSFRSSPREVDLMVSTLTARHRGGEGTFRGIASHHLRSVEQGDTVLARVLPGREEFRLPEDPAVPVVLVSAGTGLAPFRGGILDRLHRRAAGTLLCYFGCGHRDIDFLHREDLETAESAGVVSLRPAFYHAPENGARFVQNRIARDSEEIWSVLEAGGRVHVCDDGRRMAPAVREAFMAVHRWNTGASDEEAAVWLTGLVESGRYVEEVWPG
ncbi:cytochrome P450 [Streptomyces albidoflavus]